MKRIFYILFLIIIFNLPIQVNSKNLYFLTGVVINEQTKKPVIGASIRLLGTAIGAISNKKGEFLFKSISTGTYTLLVTCIGYESKKIKLSFKPKYDIDTVKIDIFLKESAFKTDEIIVSADKKVQAVQDVPISISIIDSKNILERNIVQFDEVLKYVPGIQLNNQNISIRGSSGFAFGLGSRVTLLIDGFPMLSGDNGDIKFDIFPATEIKRIEVIKGAGSALYGTGAIGGVVNVIPKEPEKAPSLYIKGYTGIYTLPLYEQWRYRETTPFRSGAVASYSQSLGKLSALISGQLYKDEGFHDYGDETRYNLFGNFKYKLNDKSDITLLSNYSSDNSTDWVYWNSLDSATLPPISTDRSIRINSDKLLLASKGQFIYNSKFFSIFKLGYLNTNFANTYPDNNIDYRQSTAHALYGEAQFNNITGKTSSLTYGATFNWNNVKSATYGKHEQVILSLYTQLELTNIKNLITTFGLRLDNEKTIGSDANLMLSPKLGFNFALSDRTHLRLSAGRGLRAPTIAEKFASLKFQGFEVVPNTDLKPEKSWSAEFGANTSLNFKSLALNFDGAVFYNYMNDLIEPTFDTELPNAPIKFQNITKAEISGIEFSIKTILFNFIGFNTSLTLMAPVDLTLNETLKYRSKVLWYNHISIPLKYFELQADYRYISKVVKVDDALALQIKDYDARVPAHILDVRLLINLVKLVNIPLRIGLNTNNILNYYYTEIPGNLGATRHLSLFLEGRF